MELLVKIALIIAIVIVVTLFVLAILLSLSTLMAIFGYDDTITVDDAYTAYYPFTLQYVIDQVDDPLLIDSYDLDNYGINQNSVEQKYCSVMQGYQAYVTPPNGTRISVCLFDQSAYNLWDDLVEYIPDDFSSPREKQCSQLVDGVSTFGIPLTVPHPLDGFLTLCIVDGDEAEPYLK